MTKVERTVAWGRLGKEFDRWTTMSDAELLAEVKTTMPIVVGMIQLASMSVRVHHSRSVCVEPASSFFVKPVVVRR